MTQVGWIFSKKSSSNSVVEYLGTLSSNQMDTLTTVCDTFLPSIHPNSYEEGNIHDDSFIEFLQTSASMNGTPQHVRFLYILVINFLEFEFYEYEDSDI